MMQHTQNSVGADLFIFFPFVALKFSLFFSMLAKTQMLEDVTSCSLNENGKPNGTHFLTWDLEDCSALGLLGHEFLDGFI